MPDSSARLTECFQTVFPRLDSSKISEATLDSIAEWDSMATVMLITVIEEEFKIQIDPNDLERLTSFAAILAYVRSRPHTGTT